ncbi:hypothetical protein [Alicyclobacillus mengziensis]|uniref:Peptidase MA-like domain-containing protein n=1 Tax=Alicyclobacillus mengziensis TaxID=2931921 RepID=A0A9X7VWC0_9BACL|nr:hypothetical protein [Alicyclobacillus mengziensis]QSO46273.1 hypothetical protein JZ786_17455 [Alicyclobacillus mengziensis]
MTGSALDVSAGFPSQSLLTGKRLQFYMKTRVRKSVFFLLSLLLLLTPLAQIQSSKTPILPSPVAQLRMTLAAAPAQMWTQSSVGSLVDVNLIAGDAGVSRMTINWVQSVIRNDAWPVINHLFAGASTPNVNLVLFATEQGYQGVVAQQFSGNAQVIAADTGGFTVGTTVYVPIYKYTATDSLANTIAHEFTHVFLNVTGISRLIPQWINEGFAWSAGLQAENTVNSGGVNVLLKELAAELASARHSGNLAPLTTGTEAGLQKNFEYNLEYEDYLAVDQLEKIYGMKAITQFFRQALNVGLKTSFKESFGVSLNAYEQKFYGKLNANV